MKSPYLSVVIPAYKEVDNLKRGVLDDVAAYLKKQKYTWEVLVVEDGSPDKTAEVAAKEIKKLANFRLLREPHRGKGGTVIAGVLAAKGEVVLFTDMDQATPITETEKILSQIENGYDVAIGSRSGRKGEPFSRKIMAYGFMILRTVILRLPYKDTQCGFKAFKHDAARKIFGSMKLFSEKQQSTGVTAGFDLELLYIARKKKLKVAEVPVYWEHVGSVRVNPIEDSILGFKSLLQVRLNAILGKYEI